MGTSIGPAEIRQAQEEVEDVMKNINRLAKEFQDPVKE